MDVFSSKLQASEEQEEMFSMAEGGGENAGLRRQEVCHFWLLFVFSVEGRYRAGCHRSFWKNHRSMVAGWSFDLVTTAARAAVRLPRQVGPLGETCSVLFVLQTGFFCSFWITDRVDCGDRSLGQGTVARAVEDNFSSISCLAAAGSGREPCQT